MSKLYADDYLSKLHQQIYSSVDKIKRNSKSTEFHNNEKSENEILAHRSRVEEYVYKLLPEEVSWSLQNSYPAKLETTYMANSYQSAKDVLQEPSILVDFMFKNNREFDFKV